MAAEAVRICYIEKVETLLELCCAFIKAWNINHWVDSKGGWVRKIIKYLLADILELSQYIIVILVYRDQNARVLVSIKTKNVSGHL